MMKKTWVIQVSTIATLLIIWELVGRSGLILPLVFPPFSEVIREMFILVFSGTLGPHVMTTLYEISVGFFVGSLVGLILGALIGSNSYLYRLFEPIFYYFGAVPKIILFPILLLLLGTGVGSKMGMAAVSAFFPIAVNTAVSVIGVNPIHIRAAKTLGASTSQIYFKVYLPSMLGPILTGMRLGLGVAITGALLAETVIAKTGLGFKAVQYYSQLRIAEMYALLLLIFIGAFVINALISKWTHKASQYEGNNGQNLFS